VPKDSPLRNAHPFFWGIRLNDEGKPRKDSFFALVNEGRIELVAPQRVTRFDSSGGGIVLGNGTILPSDVVILATGYTSSWTKILGKTLLDWSPRKRLIFPEPQPKPNIRLGSTLLQIPRSIRVHGLTRLSEMDR
jgi:hypothetical protein